jgi:hypothetical protein
MATSNLENLKGVNDLKGDGVVISTGVELVGMRLERLLFTERWGHLGKPEIESLIPKYLYSPLSEVDALDIVNEAEFLIKNGEPDIVVSSISANIINMDQDKTGLVIEINGEVVDSGEGFNVTFFKIKEKNNVFVNQTT